jgi:protoporphyrinogen oxidase
MTRPFTVVIGGGPAGLTAGHELLRLGLDGLVLEKDDTVGGLSRTARHLGFRFDIGGHRFFTKVPEVQALWEEVLGADLLERRRVSRIYFRNRFFDYPLRPWNALSGLGPVEALRILASYARARLRPSADERSFEQWVSNRFGARLYQTFFKTYTEKVWGMPCSEISADWAAQRIKSLDLAGALRNALFGGDGGAIATTLIDRFHYPRLGPGMMWERVADRLGSRVQRQVAVSRLCHSQGRVHAVVVSEPSGSERRIEADRFVSSMPLGELVLALDPPAPAPVLRLARRLRYRAFLTVCLVIDRPQVFADNWIYVHSPEVRVGRIQNFKNWSPEMVPDPAKTSLGLEYFVDQGDTLWSSSDASLVALGRDEATRLRLLQPSDVEDGAVVRMAQAYPVYDAGHRETIAGLRDYLAGLRNLQVIGRGGQHRYNNQDHSMLAGLQAARNVAGADYDVWAVNVEPSYHEGESGTGRAAPAPASPRGAGAP